MDLADEGKEPLHSNAARLPYSGIRIIEFGSLVAGPGTGKILADLGADVIKVEPLGGDLMRSMPPLKNGLSGGFVQFNKNKRSIVVDLHSDEGRKLVRDLVLGADVFFQNFRPGVIEDMGLDYESLRVENPRLIYVSISGYGESGPYSDQPAYDAAMQGLSGFMSHQGGAGVPQPIRCLIVDKVTAYSAAMAMMAALMHRERHGEAQKVSVNMLNSYSGFMNIEQLYNYAFPEADEPRTKTAELYQPLRVSDGFVIGLVGPDAHFRGFLEALGCQELAGDERFADPMTRFINTKALMAAVEPQAMKLTKAEFMALMHRYKVPFGPANTMDEFLNDPQVLHNEIWVDVPDPDVGTVRTFGSFARFERSPALVHGRSPRFGEHTDEVLNELGLSTDAISDLRSRKIVI